MKKVLLSAALLLAAVSSFAKDDSFVAPDYQFTTVKANPITPIRDQASSGTCWAFSTMAFVESEIIRINNIKDTTKYPDLSVFFVVGHSYSDKGEKYVRLNGHLNFAQGSESEDVLHVIKDYGIVPEKEMTGMQYGYKKPAQNELNNVLKAYLDAVKSIPNRNHLSSAWKKGFDAVINAYLGDYPKTFVVDGKEYTPQTYRDALKFNPDDYVSLGSFCYKPFYTWIPFEVADNWRWDNFFNIPIDELMSIIDSGINDGYTISWGTDVSTTGFSRKGIAVLPDVEASKAAGSDQDHWVGKEEGKPAPVIVVEKEPTDASRQAEFDNLTMTDDHGMQIYGIAKNQDGKKFYMVKNSWGEDVGYKGIWYVSEAFVKAETVCILIHKSALPKDLKVKLGIK